MELLEYLILEYSLFISGILFTIAALVISETGKIFIGSLIYLIGDVVYLIYSIVLDNIFGIISLILALLFGARTLYKMHSGIYRKELEDKTYKRNKFFYKYFKV